MSHRDYDEPGYDPGPCYTPCAMCSDKRPYEELDAEGCCSDECRRDLEDGEEPRDRESGECPIDGVGFAEPGGNSALRAATRGNPRNLPCPNCGGANRLTPADRAAGYQCDSCADRAEGGGGY